MTDLPEPVFRLEHELVDGRGELIAMVGAICVTIPLTEAWTRLMHVLLEAQDADPPRPADIRGMRRYPQIAREYARLAGFSVPPQGRAMAKSMVRMQRRFDAAWTALLPAHDPPRLFDRQGVRGARLAMEIPPKRRRVRDFGRREKGEGEEE